MEPLDINRYFTKEQDASIQSSYQRYPKDFDLGNNQRQLYPRCRCYNSIEDLIRREYEFMGGNPNSKSNYILRLGFEKTTMLSLIESGQFHLGIIDAINLKDLWHVYSPDDIFGYFDPNPSLFQMNVLKL